MTESPTTLSPRILAGVFLATFATLAIELFLSRFISVLYLAEDAFWVIAIALLGFGIGGAAVAIGGDWLSQRSRKLMPWLVLAIGISGLAPVLIFSSLRPESISLHAQLSWTFFVLSVSCVPPFLFASLFLALVFMRWRSHIGRLYFFDLTGSGIGCVAFLVLLSTVGLERGMLVTAAVALVAALALSKPLAKPLVAAVVVAGAGLLAVAVSFSGTSASVPFVPKELNMLDRNQGEMARHEFQQWDPASRIDVVSVPDHRLGLPDELDFKLLTQDGGAPSILLGFDGDVTELVFPAQCMLGMVQWIKDRPSTLIIGAGGGPDVVIALNHGASPITVVELNRTTIDVVGEHFSDFVGDLYGRPGVEVIHDDGRHFVRTTDQHFDVIQLSGVDTIAVGSGGAVQNLSENYLYTIEAFGDFWDHLSEDGILSLNYPGKEAGYRILVMFLKLLHDRGVVDPGTHLVVAWSAGYSGVLLKRTPFTQQEIDVISSRFDGPLYGLLLPLYLSLWPDYFYTEEALGEHALLHTPFTDQQTVASALVTTWTAYPNTEEFWALTGYFTPPVDDMPFFHRPLNVDSRFASRLLWLFVPVLLFIIAPLFVFKRRGLSVAGAFPLSIYFGCLGFAFIAIEMTMLQRFILFLGHPSLSFAVVLSVLLISSGVGSLLAGRAQAPIQAIRIAVIGIFIFTIAFNIGIGPLSSALLAAPLVLRVGIVMLIIIPIGLSMGVMFPSGIRLLEGRSQLFVPWAWGINGALSVVGSILSLYLAMKVGFVSLIWLALVVYLAAFLAARRAAANNTRAATLGAP